MAVAEWEAENGAFTEAELTAAELTAARRRVAKPGSLVEWLARPPIRLR